MSRKFTAALGIALTAFTMQLTMAADMGTQTVAKDKLDSARQYIQARQWDAALRELKQVEDRTSADWNNLMGYTLRKSTTPDLVASERYYDAALRIDPRHRNALEYSGELYLMKGDLPRAQSRLATLATECASKCEQYTELLEAINRYQANGNKYLPKGNW
ncbi:tetratricopeptide repeat protein [Paucibacter sp. PLA-PC-4]|uniref:tetratricopeptide repeat protein n=1 Tax=Paucibacter sp. PLA-PC-4 TaxID=2993655 RepID=UPI00224AD044|nr:tetratricopeptide repeat protein [Paucibacter sp. PLA-PC-4]MCX2865571.1 tetratricopeptide repeat protein [Paucibacter sp. PLA-PC-4]